jgi:hypothetical protein
MNRSLYFAVPLIICGCAVEEAKPPPGPVAEVPTCVTPAECDAKWAAARTFVLNNAGFKFQTYTADFMETYSPTGGSVSLGAQINKQPNPAGGFFITAKFWCDNAFGCMPKTGVTLNKFNAALDAVQTR